METGVVGNAWLPTLTTTVFVNICLVSRGGRIFGFRILNWHDRHNMVDESWNALYSVKLMMAAPAPHTNLIKSIIRAFSATFEDIGV